MNDPVRLVALISAGGTTLQNLLDRTRDGRLNARVIGVVSSRAEAGGVGRAELAGVPVRIVSRKEAGKETRDTRHETRERNQETGVRNQEAKDSRQETGNKNQEEQAGDSLVSRVSCLVSSFPDRVWAVVREFRPDIVCLAGWLHLIPVPDDFRLRVLNIHPSLLPSFGGKGMYGRHVHEAVLAYGAKVTGCTVHFADDSYDTGPILVQKCVPVKEGDDPDTLAARVFQAECEAYPEAIELLAAGRVTVQGRRVVISD